MSDFQLPRRTLLGGAAALVATSAARGETAKPRVAIHTKVGTIVVELEITKAPLTSKNFLRYVDAKAYDGGTFFRTVKMPGAPQDGSIVGGLAPHAHPFPPIAHESTTMTGLRHTTGTLSLGRFQPGTATADFFICLSPEPYLDAHPGAKGDNLGYAAFGHVVSGLGVARRIHAMPANRTSPFPDQKGQWLQPPVTILDMRRV